MESPAARIAGHYAVLEGLSDAELLDRLRAFDPLPQCDDDDAIWDDDESWDRVYLLIAMADSIAARRLVAGIEPLYQRLTLGDPGETMRGIRHSPEAVVNPHWHVLTEILRPLTRYRLPGCRRWSIAELGVLRDPTTIGDLMGALDDPEPIVRSEACFSLSMIAKEVEIHDRQDTAERLLEVSASDASEMVRRTARRAAERLMA